MNELKHGWHQITEYLPDDEAVLVDSFASSPGADWGVFGRLAGPDGPSRAEH